MKKKLYFIIHLTALYFFCFNVACAQQANPIKYQQTEVEAKATVKTVLKKSPVIDGHNDVFAWYFGCKYKKLKKCPQDISDYRLDTISKGQTDIPRWRKGGVGGVLINVYSDSLESFLQAYDLLYRLEKTYAKDLEIVGTATNMRKAIANKKIALLPMLEGAVQLKDKPELLRMFYKLGLRCVTFAYETNNLADGSDDKPLHNGISDLGKQMIAEMNRLGIIIDMSHISAKAMSDILDITKAPVIFSHSNARAICDVNRNVPDSILLRLKANGGIIMIDMVPDHASNAFGKWMKEGDSLYFTTKAQFTGDKKKLQQVMAEWDSKNPMPKVSIADVADHFDYVKNLIGVDHIGISGDYDGMTATIPELKDVSCFPNLLNELAKRGWKENELKKITGENFLRVFENVEKVKL